jgi:hypothetical protein
MASTVLLTLGRLPVALSLARAFAARGCRVVVADPFRWHIARPSRAVHRCIRVASPNTDPDTYQQQMLQLIDEESVDLVVPVSEEVQHVAALRASLPGHVRVLGPTETQCRELQDKVAFVQRAEALGLAAPETALANTAAAQAIADRVATISKPLQGCSGLGLAHYPAGCKLPNLPEGTLVQRAINGPTWSTLTLLDRGREVGTALYRGRTFSHTVSVCFESLAQTDAVRRWVEDFIAALDFSGFVGLDLMIDENGEPVGIECNPRPTSGLHFFDPEQLADALLDETPDRRVTIDVGARKQWAYSTLTEAWAAALRGQFRTGGKIIREMLNARDVVWSSADPLPFLLMTPLSLEILWPAMRQGISVGEACQRDIAPMFTATPRPGPDATQSLARGRT